MRAALFALSCLLAANAACEEASYRISGGELPTSAAANGYVQEVRSTGDSAVEVHVYTSLSPIGESTSYGKVLAGDRPDVPDAFVLPPRLVELLTPDLDAWEAATVVLTWVARHLEVDSSDNGAQDATSVLVRGSGRCSGVSNAAVGLLRAAGFHARTVSGLLVGDDKVIRHRWLECRLPTSGWVPSDPTLGLWTITPRHIAYADTVLDLPVVEVLLEGNDGLERLPSREGRLIRPNKGAGLVCRMPTQWGGEAPIAILRGGGGESRRARIDPEARFSDLLPGRWVLEVEAGGTIIDRRELRLRAGDLQSYTVQPFQKDQQGGPGR